MPQPRASALPSIMMPCSCGGPNDLLLKRFNKSLRHSGGDEFYLAYATMVGDVFRPISVCRWQCLVRSRVVEQQLAGGFRQPRLGEASAGSRTSDAITDPDPQNVINLMDVLKRSLAAEQPSAAAPRRPPAPSKSFRDKRFTARSRKTG
jgi:hypothetical protein